MLGPNSHAPSGRAGTYGPEFFYQIVEVVSSGPDLGTILHRFVPLVTAATECHGCFIYFIEDSHLVLRTASAGYAHLEGKVRLGPEEGLTGWVARNRRSAFIKDKALEDPRMAFVPELEDEQYQSLVSVPILSREGAVIGVITLHARAPHEFRPHDLEFLETAASLIAGAIENARLYEEAVSRVKQLTELSTLAQKVAAAGTMHELLATVTEGCRKLLPASHCDIYLTDPDGQLELALAAPPRLGTPALEAGRLWSRIMAADEAGDAQRGLAELVWGTAVEGVPLFAPLSVGEERVGLLCALVERASHDRRSLLASVAAYLAVAVRRRQLIESLEEQNLVKDFFEALARGGADVRWLNQQAAKLHCDLNAEHFVVQALPGMPAQKPRSESKSQGRSAPDWGELAARMEARLRLELPRSIFDARENLLRGLVRIPPQGPDSALEIVRRVYQSVGGADRGSLALGVSNPCHGPASIPRGFEEAASAAEVGSLLRGEAGVFAYEDLGAYRYIANAEGSVRDRYQDRLGRLVDYRKRRGTDLLRTLEAYVENRGSIANAARALHLHPNTLRQRLARIERLTGFKLDREDWLSLGMAIKVVKLRIIRSTGSAPMPDS